MAYTLDLLQQQPPLGAVPGLNSLQIGSRSHCAGPSKAGAWVGAAGAPGSTAAARGQQTTDAAAEGAGGVSG